MTARVHVPLGARSYDIVIGTGLIAAAGAEVARILHQPRCIIVSDSNVAPLFLQPLRQSLEEAGVRCDDKIVAAGEQTKDFAQLAMLVDELLALAPDRATALIALGGGVVGDLVGFAASILLRGVDFVQIPTTLLAQVDSSVGGKTGINARHGKNLVGSFYQPRLVLADVAALDSLPRRQLLAGYAEVVKYGLISDRPFFDWLAAHGQALLAGAGTERIHAVERSCQVKAGIVGRDERESAERALLNLGHTFAHAFETAAGYGDALLHGEAVAIGACLAFDLSARLGLCTVDDTQLVRRHFADHGLATDLPSTAASWSIEKLLDSMHRDKKAEGGHLVFVLARGIGEAFVARDVTADAVRPVLADALQRAKGNDKYALFAED